MFIISKHALGKIHLALLVILVYLSFNYPYIRIARGSDWHILMNFVGLLSVAFVLKNRYVLSGLFSSLAALSWAPGIVFFFATLFTVMLFPNDKRKGKLWIRVFPWKPLTKKPTEVRMGKGKGDPEFWVDVVRPGKIIYELEGVSTSLAKEAMRLASHKLPMKTKFIARKGGELR